MNELVERAFRASSEVEWWPAFAAAVRGALFSSDVVALNVVSAANGFGWFGPVFPEAARTLMPVNSRMDEVLTGNHPFSARTRAGPIREPLKVTDLVSSREWRRLPAYERMRDLTGGVHHMIIQIPRPAPYNETVSVVRADRDFTAQEMTAARQLQSVLSVVVPFLRRVEVRRSRLGPLRESEAEVVASVLGLTARERDVLGLLNDGYSTDRMAETMAVDVRTVYKHEQHLYRKLEVNSAREALQKARHLGLITIGPLVAQVNGSRPTPSLTRREEAVLQMVAGGLSNAAIADVLSISPKTVEVHVSHLLRKLDTRTRAQAVAVAFRSGLLV